MTFYVRRGKYNIPANLAGVISQSMVNTNNVETVDDVSGFMLVTNVGSQTYSIKFKLLPSVSGNNPSNMPEVKAGIFTGMGLNIKSFSLPGSDPIYQVLGRDTKRLQLTGLLTGEEVFTGVENSGEAKTAIQSKNQLEQFVSFGRPVRITLKGVYENGNGTALNVTVIQKYYLIQQCRTWIARLNRVYYSLDLLEPPSS